jgi:hypothetical protein
MGELLDFSTLALAKKLKALSVNEREYIYQAISILKGPDESSRGYLRGTIESLHREIVKVEKEGSAK